jgi:hypothetical protein
MAARGVTVNAERNSDNFRWPFWEIYINLIAAVSVEGRPCLMLNFDSIPITWTCGEQDDMQHQAVLSPGTLPF